MLEIALAVSLVAGQAENAENFTGHLEQIEQRLAATTDYCHVRLKPDTTYGRE